MPSPLPWIVQKFGGTSIGKLLDAITEDIIPSYYIGKEPLSPTQRHSRDNSNGNNIVVVCSARSGVNKSTGTTSLLLRAASLAESHSTECEEEILDEVIDMLIEEHRLAARDALQSKNAGGGVVADSEILVQLEQDIVTECEAIRSFLHAAKVRSRIGIRS
jgi:aspartate kinase